MMVYSRQQWLVLVTSLCASMFCAMVYSLQAPFYPREAESKGIRPWMYGFVFGIYEGGIFVSSFFSGWVIKKMGAKFVFIAGLFLEGGSCILFGLLYLINNGTIFFTYSVLLRIIESFGQAAAFTAMVSTCSTLFPDSVGSIVSLTQTFFGLGMIAGPSIGGLLYDTGGFLLPFAVVGSILWLCTLASYLALLPVNISNPIDQESNVNTFLLLRIPSVWVGILSVAVGNISIGYIQATLEPHIRHFELSNKLLGLVFVLNGLSYSLTSPIWGKLCDIGVDPRVCCFFGSLIICLGFSLIGPFPFIPNINPTLELVIIGLVLVGIGNGGVFTPGLVCICKTAFSNGFPDNSVTYAMASGLWQTSFSIGGAVGPGVAGILFDAFKFRIGSLYVIGVNLCIAIITSRIVIVSLLKCNFLTQQPPEEPQDEVAPLDSSLEKKVRPIRDRVRVSSFSAA